MKLTIARTITAAALVSGAMLTGQPASALGIKNCIGEPIRVTISKDLGNKLLPLRSKTLRANRYHRFRLAKKRYVAKIFKPKPGADEYVSGGEVHGGADFIVVRRRPKVDLGIDLGDFHIERGKFCR